jgi:hypothetical protein
MIKYLVSVLCLAAFVLGCGQTPTFSGPKYSKGQKVYVWTGDFQGCEATIGVYVGEGVYQLNHIKGKNGVDYTGTLREFEISDLAPEPCEPATTVDTKFYFGQKVKIVRGFYRKQLAFVRSYDGKCYELLTTSLDGLYRSEKVTVDEDCIEEYKPTKAEIDRLEQWKEAVGRAAEEKPETPKASNG